MIVKKTIDNKKDSVGVTGGTPYLYGSKIMWSFPQIKLVIPVPKSQVFLRVDYHKKHKRPLDYDFQIKTTC